MLIFLGWEKAASCVFVGEWGGFGYDVRVTQFVAVFVLHGFLLGG